MVLNSLHPDNRGLHINDPDGEDFFRRLNRGIQEIGAYFAQYSPNGYDRTLD